MNEKNENKNEPRKKNSNRNRKEGDYKPSGRSGPTNFIYNVYKLPPIFYFYGSGLNQSRIFQFKIIDENGQQTVKKLQTNL